MTWFIRYLCFLLLSLCLYIYWWTISLDCIILSLTWFIRYLCFYYYHCVYTSTGGLLVLIVSSSHWHGLLDISVFLISLCLYIYWWTISLDCIILPVTWFIRYLCFYYYHCVYTSTGGLLVLIVSSSQWHGLLDISVFITITVSMHLLVAIILDCIILSVAWFIRYLCFYYYQCVYTSTGGLLVLIVSSSQWHGSLDISVFITITVSIHLLVDY